MNLKVDQLIRPFSRGFSALSVKYIIEDLSRRFAANIQDKIEYKIIKVKNTYYIWCKIPSESNDKYPDEEIYYDVILQLDPPNTSSLQNPSIRDYDVKVYANIPSFVFTFNYVYYSKNSLIKMPAGFYSRKSITMKPKIRNPLQLLGIDKSLWFAVCFLDKMKLFNRANADAAIDVQLDLEKLIKTLKIKTQDEKLSECEYRIHKHSNSVQKTKYDDKLSKAELRELEKNEKDKYRRKDKSAHGKKGDSSNLDDESLYSDLSNTLTPQNTSSLSKKTAGKNTETVIKRNLDSNLHSNLNSGLSKRKK